MSYFFTPKKIGNNADIARHTEHQKELERKIEILELNENRTKKEDYSLTVYRSFLCKLLESKAQVVDNIGRKK